MKCMETLLPPSEQYNSSFCFDLQLFAGEKTEEPTAKRKNDARAKGQVARSQEINGAFVLLAGFAMLKIFGHSIYTDLTDYMRYIFGHLNQGIDTESVMRLFIGIITILAKTSFPIMAAIMIMGLAINLFQVGINFTTEPVGFKPENLNPINGFGRIFSSRALIELVKSLFKIVIIGFLIYDYLKDEIFHMPRFIFSDLNASLDGIAAIILSLAFKICMLYLVLAILDYAYQKWKHNKDLKMSKQDVKEEFKQMEGDPQIKGKIKSKQRQMAMQRMMREVPKADVIVTNPTHFAVALQYQKGMPAPLVLAKGQDLVAQKIKAIARDANITIVENKPLARALYAVVPVGGYVPQELYKSVAEVLAYVYRLKRKRLA